MSEIRYNHLDDAYVIIAPERLHRPDYMSWHEEGQSDAICPFCEGNENLTPDELYAIREKGGRANSAPWRTRVVPNLYKAVQIEAPNRSHGEGMNSVWEGFGAHEVIIDTPVHHRSMETWDATEYYYWLLTMQSRLKDLRGDSRIVHIALFKNHGMGAGATQTHPHTQLIALPVVPKSAVRMLERNYAHYREHGRGIIDDLLAQEERDKSRIVVSNGAFVAFCPFASAFPFEVMIVAKEAVYALEQIDEDRLHQLSVLLQDVLSRMNAQLGNFDFNLSVSTPPMQRSFDTAHLYDLREALCRFHIRIMPRIYRHGGFELATGTMVNPVAPERCAQLLRDEAAQ